MKKIQQIIILVGLVWGLAASFSANADLTLREKLIQDRIRPVGDVYMDGQQPQPAAAGPMSPEDIYNKYCVLCHKAGVSGAPIVGNKDAWAARIKTGLDTLVTHAIHGYKAMPPKGTCMTCSDDDIHGTVQYMVEQSS